ncbi:RSM27 [Sanghuangporus sanghuang]
MAESVAPKLLKSLARLRCSIFQTTFNPTSRRTGAKYLKARLRGPSMVQYYPERSPSIGDLNKMYPGWNLVDVHEVRRNISIQEHKDRGKGAPKKAKNKEESRRIKKRR